MAEERLTLEELSTPSNRHGPIRHPVQFHFAPMYRMVMPQVKFTPHRRATKDSDIIP
jgi:hypothetical protein